MISAVLSVEPSSTIIRSSGTCDWRIKASILRTDSAMRPASLNAGTTIDTDVSDAFINRGIVSSRFCMNDRLLRACRRQPVDRTPVWMMRQAGRYLKEYRDIRQKVGFLELCKNTDLAAEVSLQPYRILGVDAVIFFSDILIPVEAMGVGVSLTDKGPEISNPIRSKRDVDALSIPDPGIELPFVATIIKRLRQELRDEVPLIGFAGAPWTLASYLIEGGGSKSFGVIKGLAYREPDVLHALLDKLASTVGAYLLFQIEAGAQVVQLFDTWAGELNRSDYEEFALPYTQKIFDAVGPRVPRILYLNGTSAT